MQIAKVACWMKMHQWDGGRCTRCGKTRDEEHDVHGCKWALLRREDQQIVRASKLWGQGKNEDADRYVRRLAAEDRHRRRRGDRFDDRLHAGVRIMAMRLRKQGEPDRALAILGGANRSLADSYIGVSTILLAGDLRIELSRTRALQPQLYSLMAKLSRRMLNERLLTLWK